MAENNDPEQTDCLRKKMQGLFDKAQENLISAFEDYPFIVDPTPCTKGDLDVQKSKI